MLLSQDARSGSELRSGLRIDDGVELTQSIHVFIRVVLAEEQLSTGGQGGPHSGRCAAPVAAIHRGQWGACQGSWHDSSVLAPGTDDRLPGVGLVVTHHGLATATSQQG